MTNLPMIRAAALASAFAFVLAGAAQGAMVPDGVKLAPDASQTFTYRVLDSFPTIDPQLSEDVSGAEVERDLFEGLVNQDATGALVPGVATSWEATEGNQTWTFHLRDNAKWSNGDPVTAGDFVYAWRRLADPKTASPYAWYMELMSVQNASDIIAGKKDPSELGVSAPDAQTLVVKLSAPLPYFADMTVNSSTFPTPQKVVEKFGDKWTQPENIVSNGAYTLKEWVPGERLVRVRNPKYWDNAHTVIESTTALIINDENQALTRFLAGELDRTEVPAGQYPTLNKEHPDETVVFPRLCNYYYTFNLSASGPEAFKDVRVRRALSLAIDRNVITEQVLQGGQFPAYTFTPAATANFDVPDVPAADMSQADRDAQAKELLAAAGYGPDHPLSFNMLYNTSEAHKQIATVMSQMWKQKLGVTATLANMEWKTFLTERGNQNYDMARGAWCGDYNEPSTFLDLLTTNSGYNDGKYSNGAVDQLMADAKHAADPSSNYKGVEEIMADEVPVIPIYHYTGVYMMTPGLIPSWPVKNVQQNWYSKDLYKVAK